MAYTGNIKNTSYNMKAKIRAVLYSIHTTHTAVRHLYTHNKSNDVVPVWHCIIKQQKQAQRQPCPVDLV